jgi:hypothetical protein
VNFLTSILNFSNNSFSSIMLDLNPFFKISSKFLMTKTISYSKGFCRRLNFFTKSLSVPFCINIFFQNNINFWILNRRLWKTFILKYIINIQIFSSFYRLGSLLILLLYFLFKSSFFAYLIIWISVNVVVNVIQIIWIN